MTLIPVIIINKEGLSCVKGDPQGVGEMIWRCDGRLW